MAASPPRSSIVSVFSPYLTRKRKRDDSDEKIGTSKHLKTSDCDSKRRSVPYILVMMNKIFVRLGCSGMKVFCDYPNCLFTPQIYTPPARNFVRLHADYGLRYMHCMCACEGHGRQFSDIQKHQVSVLCQIRDRLLKRQLTAADAEKVKTAGNERRGWFRCVPVRLFFQAAYSFVKKTHLTPSLEYYESILQQRTPPQFQFARIVDWLDDDCMLEAFRLFDSVFRMDVQL